MKRNQDKTARLLTGAGATALLIAVLATTNAIHHALGRAPGTLSWGPVVFRAVLAFHGLVLVVAGLLWKRFQPETNISALPSRRGARDWRPWYVLAAISAVAFVLRLWQLNSCLWIDELMTLLDYARPSLGTIVSSFESQNQHMLFSILAHFSIRTFGESAWALRLPSVIFGVGSLWALYLLGRRLVGTLETLLACGLMAVSYHHIWFSQNARGYVGLLCFATLATWLWLEALERHAIKFYVLYAIAIALGMWVHLTMAFVVAAHGLIHLAVLVRRAPDSSTPAVSFRTAVWHMIVGYGLAVTVTLQLYALALPQFFHQGFGEGVATQSEWTNPFWVIREGLRGLQIGWSGALVVFCGALLAASGWIAILRKDWRAAMAFILPGLLGGATMLALHHPLWPRFFLFSLGFALLTVVHGGMTLGRLVVFPLPAEKRQSWGATLGVAVVALMILASVATLPRYYEFPKQDFTGAHAFVERNRRPGEAVVAVGLAGVAYRDYFAPQWLDAETKAGLDRVREQHRDLWLVYTIPAQIRALDPEFWSEIERDFRVVKVFRGTLGGGDVVVCVPNRRSQADSRRQAQEQMVAAQQR